MKVDLTRLVRIGNDTVDSEASKLNSVTVLLSWLCKNIDLDVHCLQMRSILKLFEIETSANLILEISFRGTKR